MRPDEPVSDALAGVCGSAGPECSGRTACGREAVAPECVPAIISRLCTFDTSLRGLLRRLPTRQSGRSCPVLCACQTCGPRRLPNLASIARAQTP